MSNQSETHVEVSQQNVKEQMVIFIKVGEFFTLQCTIAGRLGWVVTLVQAGIWAYWVLTRLAIL